MGIWGHGWKKAITIGVLIALIGAGMAWAKGTVSFLEKSVSGLAAQIVTAAPSEPAANAIASFSVTAGAVDRTGPQLVNLPTGTTPGGDGDNKNSGAKYLAQKGLSNGGDYDNSQKMNAAEEKQQVTPEIPKGVVTVELAALSNNMTVKDLDELKSRGRFSGSAKVVKINASEAEILRHLNANPGLIETLNEKGIFLIANNGRAIELSPRPQTYYAGTGITYIAYHGVVLEIIDMKSVAAFNYKTGQRIEIHATLSNALSKGKKD